MSNKQVPFSKMKLEEPEQNIDADIQQRISGFLDDIRPLLDKYELKLGALPSITPQGTLSAQLGFNSTRKSKDTPQENNSSLLEG